MPNEGGDWIMRGMDFDDPRRIKTSKELIDYINMVGFLPLFANGLPMFSVEDHVSPLFWWTGDPRQDPWEWREILARSGEVAYGKFFKGRAGFISREWYPVFANYRRDGYDFDSLWEDEKASYREKKIMDVFLNEDELFSYMIKRKAGFGKDGEKNFEGIITDLQMKGYLIVKDFRRRKRLHDGVEYGWPIAVYTPSENLMGKDAIAEGYKEDPKDSFHRIVEKIHLEFPQAAEQQIQDIMENH